MQTIDQILKVPEEDEVCVDVDGAVQGREHVGDEEPLSGAHPKHVLHVLPLLKIIMDQEEGMMVGDQRHQIKIIVGGVAVQII